jgi:hypothetical protein
MASLGCLAIKDFQMRAGSEMLQPDLNINLKIPKRSSKNKQNKMATGTVPVASHPRQGGKTA